MSVYNNEAFLGPAIESILAQSFTDFEFLILNDGSTDGSRAIIDAHAARDSRIRPIHRENRGLVASLNELVAKSRAPLIARMDGDDIALPERFARQKEFLDAHPDYGVVGCFTQAMDERGEPQPWRNVDYPTDHAAFAAAIGKGPLLCHPSVLMRREAVTAVGGYHAAFRHCEDLDLWLRLSTVTRMCSIPERLIRYRYSDQQVSSRHVVPQAINAAVSLLAHELRQQGLPDPTEHLDALPEIGGFDALFGRPGVDQALLDRMIPTIIDSESALEGEGLELIIDYVRKGGRCAGLPRTVLRLVRMGKPVGALRLALALVSG